MNFSSDTARPGRPTRRALLLGASAGLLGLGLTACASEDDLSQDANSAQNTGYVAGDGSVSEYPAAERGEPVAFTGAFFDGTEHTAQEYRGKPVLMNFWYAGCAPCRAEAPDLKELAAAYGEDVHFLGVNLRDEKSTAAAFDRTFEIPYPSFEDRNGKVLLSLSQYVPAQAVPTTLVLDAQGRPAARILGRINRSVLETVLKDVVAENA